MFVSQKAKMKFGCPYCADAKIYRTDTTVEADCPHKTCPYKADIKPYKTFEALCKAEVKPIHVIGDDGEEETYDDYKEEDFEETDF